MPTFNSNYDKDSNEDIIENKLKSSDVHLAGKYYFFNNKVIIFIAISITYFYR